MKTAMRMIMVAAVFFVMMLGLNKLLMAQTTHTQIHESLPDSSGNAALPSFFIDQYSPGMPLEGIPVVVPEKAGPWAIVRGDFALMIEIRTFPKGVLSYAVTTATEATERKAELIHVQWDQIIFRLKPADLKIRYERRQQ